MSAELTGLLEAAARGDRDAFDRAFGLLYAELAALARAQRGRRRDNPTLDTTALVHEAYLKLLKPMAVAPAGDPRWESRGHFFALAARAMRHILVNYAEARRAAKRGGGARLVTLDESGGAERAFNPVAAEAADEILALHEALDRLERLDPRQARVVECRFFAGLTVPDTAAALGLSEATVKRDWRLASAWLHRELRAS